MASKLTYAVVAVVIVIVVIAGLGFGLHLFTPGKQSTSTIVIASSVVPASLDPPVAYDTGSVFFDDQIYQTLIGYGTTTFIGSTVGSIAPVPELATTWQVYGNGSVLFNLTHNAKFANGDPFNASDVQFSLDRVITMHQGPSFHVYQFLNKSGIHVLNTYQILLVPSAPYPWFLNLFQLWVTGIVDPNFVNAHGGVVADKTNPYMANHTMGTGPYVLQSETASQITMVYNQNYTGQKPNVTQIVYNIVNDPATQQTMLEKGSANLALNIPLAQINTVRNYSNVKVISGPTSSEWYIGLDENVTPFNNLDVRKAIEFAVNPAQLTQYSTFGFGIPIKSVIAPTVESYIPAFKNYTQNLSMARHYLNLSGHGGGFSTSFYYISGDPVGTAISTKLEQELKAININVTLNPLASNTFQDEAGKGTFPMFFEGWVNLLATPDDGIRPLFSIPNMGLGGNYNYFSNTTVNTSIFEAGSLINQTQRDAIYENVQNILAQQAVEVPLFNEANVLPMTSNVHNLYAYPTYDIFISQVYLT